MRKLTYSLMLFVLAILVVAPAMAQSGAQERAANLRAQLTDLQAQQADLQSRLAQLDEDIKPENIERSLAGIGSTHPEDLREARRRKLDIQRKGIQSQLDTLATTRARLEAAIATADAQGYRETVGPNLSGDTTAIPKSTKAIVNRSIRQKHRLKRRRLHKR
jgi:cell division protein FtsB